MRVPGSDWSNWQDDKSTPQKVNFTKAKNQGMKFAFIKVSERRNVDMDFIYNWQAAKIAGIPRGAYHFLRWDLPGTLQARIFCNLIKEDPGELPPVADFEAPASDGLYPSNALLQQFLEEVEIILGVKPIIYTSTGFWNANGKNKGTSVYDQKWLYWDLWIANYISGFDKTKGLQEYENREPVIPYPWKGSKGWKFWQYTSGGDGIKFGAESKGLDLNYFNGDEEDFAFYLGDSGPYEEPGGSPTGDHEKRIVLLEKNLTELTAWAKGLNFK